MFRQSVRIKAAVYLIVCLYSLQRPTARFAPLHVAGITDGLVNGHTQVGLGYDAFTTAANQQ